MNGAATVVYGVAANLTAKDLPSDATGTVSFSDGSVTLCSASVTAGQASCQTSQLPLGASTVTTSYGGDGNYLGVSATSSATVAKALPAIAVGQPSAVNDSATVTYGTAANLGVTGLPGDATGTVVYTDGPLTLCTAAVSAGLAPCSTSLLPAGTSTVTATYGGDDDYLGASAGSSVTVAKATVTAGPVSAVGPQANLTRTFAFGIGGFPLAATGSVSFLFVGAGSTPLCQAPLQGGTASCVAAVPGPGTVVASYPGDTDYAALSTAGVSVTPAKAGSTLALDQPSGDVAAAPGDGIQFAATVTVSAADATAPTGQVTFFIGSRSACSASLSAGTASCEATVAAADGGALSAVYGGDSATQHSSATGGNLTVWSPLRSWRHRRRARTRRRPTRRPPSRPTRPRRPRRLRPRPPLQARALRRPGARS